MSNDLTTVFISILYIIVLAFCGWVFYEMLWHGKVYGKPIRMKQVWSQQRLLENRGDQADRIRADLKSVVMSKGIPDLQFSENRISYSRNKFLLFQRKLGLGLFTSMAVSIEPQGVDLAVDVRQMEINILGAGGSFLRIFLAIAFIGAGLLTLALMGAGIILIIIGIILFPWKVNSALSNTYKSGSEFLYSAVIQSLDKVLQ